MTKNDMYLYDKLENEASKFKHQCKCGTKTVIYPFEHRDFKICRGCGNRIYSDIKEQKRYEFRNELNRRLK